uniref:Uncharacterized protein n=1 Tax=Ciona intestinalis TaxID=7719 RepID=H2XLC5_CIOIN
MKCKTRKKTSNELSTFKVKPSCIMALAPMCHNSQSKIVKPLHCNL